MAPQMSLTVANLLHRAVLANMDVQPIGLVVHGHHGIGLDDAVLLGEILLCECLLVHCQQMLFTLYRQYCKVPKPGSMCCKSGMSMGRDTEGRFSTVGYGRRDVRSRCGCRRWICP
jgi:hypothetical protein